MNSQKHRSALWVLAVFFVLSISGGLALVYFADKNSTSKVTLYGNLKGYFQTYRAYKGESQTILASFSSLEETFRTKGIKVYIESKGELRVDIGRALNTEKDTRERDRAENIALYLFPDLLPENDYERDVAFEHWYPHQRYIEKNPGTVGSRKQFEELKNNVWNYENPDRQAPDISEYADKVIRIYDEISRGE